MPSSSRQPSRRSASPSSLTSSVSSGAWTGWRTASTLLRGYDARLWLFVQDLSQLKAVYPRWQSFIANTTRQFFGTADYDTARCVSDGLSHQTISFETASRSYQG